ncbi:hypothetical protein [Chishuiella changwenlii]|uniref:hypothetical protein n=1 Tax=Chishuiella changwenlii TaxID=1434701 RepID=UPI002FDAA2CA
MKKLINIGLAIIFFVSLFSCNNFTKKDAEKYLPGKYLYEFPSGETSILIINSDFTFNNKIYSKDEKDLLYEANGSMEVDGRQIEFHDFLLFFDHNETDMIFTKPEGLGGISSVYWEKPNKNQNTVLIHYNSYNYVFKKIK